MKKKNAHEKEKNKKAEEGTGVQIRKGRGQEDPETGGTVGSRGVGRGGGTNAYIFLPPIRLMPYKYKPAKKRGVRSRNNKTKIIFIALAASAVLVLAASAMLQYFSTDGFVGADIIRVSGDSIVIGNNCTAIVATTSPERAQSIEQGLGGVMGERPNTHDTFAQALESFNITMEAVKFNNYDGRYYYSDIVLSSGSKVLALDAMPSDAIALALRMNATIYINKTLLAQIGKNIC